MKIFNGFAEWRRYLLNALLHLCKGIARIVVAVSCGIVSVIVHLWNWSCRLVGRFPNVALSGFLAVVLIVWILTFASMRARAIGAESQRDSISWLYHDFLKTHGYE